MTDLSTIPERYKEELYEILKSHLERKSGEIREAPIKIFEVSAKYEKGILKTLFIQFPPKMRLTNRESFENKVIKGFSDNYKVYFFGSEKHKRNITGAQRLIFTGIDMKLRKTLSKHDKYERVYTCVIREKGLRLGKEEIGVWIVTGPKGEISTVAGGNLTLPTFKKFFDILCQYSYLIES